MVYLLLGLVLLLLVLVLFTIVVFNSVGHYYLIFICVCLLLLVFDGMWWRVSLVFPDVVVFYVCCVATKVCLRGFCFTLLLWLVAYCVRLCLLRVDCLMVLVAYWFWVVAGGWWDVAGLGCCVFAGCSCFGLGVLICRFVAGG